MLQQVQRLEDRSLLSAATLGSGMEQPGATQAQDLVQFAQLLNDAGVKFYGAAWCPACTAQKELFEDGGQFLPFIEVTNPDRTLNQTGIDENITSFPTWEFQDGSRVEAVLSLDDLATESGIAIPTSAVPCFVGLPDVTVLGGSPLMIGIDGYDPNNDALTYTVTSDDPLVTAELFSGNRSMRVDVAGYGDMVFELFENRVPRATSRFIQLAEGNFFDGVIFHRVIDNFVIQGGDPSGTGGGGSTLGDFDDQFDVDLQHNSTGLLSMAKSTDDTNDSQFFVTEGPSRHLDFNHSIFGKLVEGEANRDAISNTAVNGSSQPTNVVVMDTVEIFQDTENATLMLRAAEGASGSANITVTVADSEGNTYQQTFAVTVTPDSFNGGPFLREIPDVHVVSGEPIIIELDAIDVEGDPVIFGIDTNLSDANGFTLVADAEGNPSNRIDLLGTDQSGQPLVGTFEIAVAVASPGGTPNNTADVLDEQRITLHLAPADPTVTITGTVSSVAEGTSDGGTIQIDASVPVVLRDDFGGTELDQSVWDLAEPGEPSIEGRTELSTSVAPEVSGGVLRLQVDSFNPFDPGGSFFGAAISTDDVYSLSSGLVFETRARLVGDAPDPLGRGLTASFSTFGLDQGDRDEISLDVLSNDILDGTEGVRTATSDDEAIGLSANGALSSAAGLDATVFNTYRIEWFSDRVDFFVNNTLVRSETGTVPDDPMNLGLSLFAPDSGPGFDAALQPDDNAGDNQSWFLEVDFVEIRRPLPGLTVPYSSTGTATLDADFSAGSGSVVIAADTTSSTGSVTVPVTILQDSLAERTEDATLSITADASYVIGTPGTATVSITDDDPLPTSADVEVRLVIDQTTTDGDGETDAVPTNEDWVDEWDEFFVEVWVRIPDSEGFGVTTASADLTYNTDYFTATGVEFGTPFTSDPSFTIDDANGRIDAISATADRNDAGGNRFVLLARVAFASMGQDGVTLNSQTDYATPMTDLNVTIENVVVTVSDVGGVTVNAGAAPETDVWPVIFDLDDSHGLSFGDVPDFSAVFNATTGSNPDAFQADFDRGGTVSFGDVTVLAGNFNRTRESAGRQTYAPGFPEDWTPMALNASTSGENAEIDASNEFVPGDDLSELTAAIIDLFRGAGLNDESAAELDTVTVEIADLPGRQLGMANGNEVVIDVDGAGLGWFIDATPLDNTEFNSDGSAALELSRHRYDILTVLAHEFGHILGLDHGADGSLMDDILDPGERRLNDLDDLFAEALDVAGV